MNNFQFLKKWQKLLYEIESEKIIRLKKATISYTKNSSHPFQNYALINTVLTTSELENIEKAFLSVNRVPTVYCENTVSLSGLNKLLLERKYGKKWEDSWMFYEGKEINKTN